MAKMALNGKHYCFISLENEESRFSGLDDHQYLQLSRYQQEARHFGYYEKSDCICLKIVMPASIMQLLVFQMDFCCVLMLHFTSVNVFHKHPKRYRMRAPRNLPD